MAKLNSNKDAAELFKALADENRLKILHSLYDREKCVSDLMDEMNLSQSHVSHHLKVLKTSGLIDSYRDGHRICYFLLPEVKASLSDSNQETLNLGCCEVKFR